MARRPAPHLSAAALPHGLVVVARLVGAALAYLAVLNLVVIGGYVLGQTLVPDAARGPFGLLALGLAEAAALATVLVIWRLVVHRPLAALGLDTACAPRRRWLRGGLFGALMMGCVVLVGYVLVDGSTWGVNSDALGAGLALVAGLIGFAIQGPAEEVLFRGYVLENVREEWGVRAAIVVSSLTFSLLHLSNPAFGVLPFINLVLFGVGTALYRVYVDGDQLWGVFAIHTLWNWLQQVVFGLPNSGIASAPDNTLFSITPDSSLPAPLSGGGFGPEGTLFASLVLLGLIVGSIRGRARPRSPVASAVPQGPSRKPRQPRASSGRRGQV